MATFTNEQGEWEITEILSYENGEAQVICTQHTGYTMRTWVRVAEIVIV